MIKAGKLNFDPVKTIIRYFQYVELKYNDGSGARDTTIDELINDLFDDDLYYLAEAIERDSATIHERFLNSLPEYYSIVRFY